MRIVIVNQFFPPDLAPTGIYAQDLARELGKINKVYVISSNLGYRTIDNTSSKFPVTVYHVFQLKILKSIIIVKILNFIIFYFGMFWYLCLLRPGIIISLSSPPFSTLACSIYSLLFRTINIHWSMDVYPDVIIKSFRLNYYFSFILRYVNKIILSRHRLIIALSTSMKQMLMQYVSPRRIAVIPLWATVQSSLPTIPVYSNGKLTFMYSGNMGVAHSFSGLFDAISFLSSEHYEWIFSVSGKKVRELKKFREKYNKSNVREVKFAATRTLTEHLSSVHIHIVSLDKEFEGLMVPSKIQNILAVGRPILYIGSKSSDIAKLIVKFDAGWVAEDTMKSIVKTVQEINKSEVILKAENAFALYKLLFQRSNVTKISSLLHDISAIM